MMMTGFVGFRGRKKVLSALLMGCLAVSLVRTGLAADDVPAGNPPATAVPAGDPEADFKAGKADYENNDWMAAMTTLRKAAKAGHQQAMVMLGMVLTRAAEFPEALYWYHQAARNGSLEGAYWLGTALATEPDATPAAEPDQPDAGIPRGHQEALTWLTKSAEGGFPMAMHAMYSVHALGKLGQQIDHKAALEWLKKAGEKEYAPAMKDLAKGYAQGMPELPPDPAEAQKWEKKVAEVEKALGKKTPPPGKGAGGKQK
ncbi:MAG: sel1 repeat family protein [Magnetococcales bacterium]|nr:sel1 repeat family protein [Magnetococcales bacterium]